MTDPIFRITDGTDEFDFLDPMAGLLHKTWRPSVAGFKGDGIIQESSLDDGRKLIDYRYEDAIESITLSGLDECPDEMIRRLQDLRRLLVKGANYWTNRWEDEPVWLEARAHNETNTRYAIVKNFRTPEDNDPFAQPFAHMDGSVVVDELPIFVERGPWLANPPGTGECLPLSTVKTFVQLNYRDGVRGTVGGGAFAVNNYAAIENLHSAAMTVEGFFRVNSLGSATATRLIHKTRWIMEISNTDGTLRGFVDTDTIDAESISTGTDYRDGLWHHFAMTYDNAGTRTIRLWVDGTEVSYGTQTAATGTIVSDAANGVRFIENTGSATGVDVDLGWIRLSDSIRYTIAFSVDQCVTPGIDANTAGQWHMSKLTTAGNSIPNEVTGGNPALLQGNDGTFAELCTIDVGTLEWDGEAFVRATSCDGGVFVDSRRTNVAISHIFYDDGGGGTFSANLAEATPPFDLFPDPANAGDIVYFGSSQGYNTFGPFGSLVFDLQNVFPAAVVGVWEYWSGAAWSTLTTVPDQTSGFETAGIGVVQWTHPSNWATTTVNGFLGYWVRFRLTTAAAATPVPSQQTNRIYTVVWPDVDIDGDDVKGDIDALVEFDIETIIPGAQAASSRLVFNRLSERGSTYVAAINFANDQNPSGASFTLGSSISSITSFVQAPAGFAAGATLAGATSDSIMGEVSITSPDFLNTYYRVFARFFVDGGSDGDILTWLEVKSKQVTYVDRSNDRQPIEASAFVAIDLGTVRIPTDIVTADEVLSGYTIVFEVHISTASGATFPRTLYLIDVWLATIDEWSGTFTHVQDLLVDSLTFPRVGMRGVSSTGTPVQAVFSEPIYLHPNKDQRMHFLRYSPTVNIGAIAVAEITATQSAKYLSMRGDR